MKLLLLVSGLASLPNYLLTARKHLALSQEEVAFLLGFNGEYKASGVSRHEKYAYEPTLRTALAYEAIYGEPARELFAGIYEEVEKEVEERAKVLGHRFSPKPNPKRDEVITKLASRSL